MPNRRQLWPRYRPIITYTVVLAYAAIGLGLVLQPARFGATPSYANLLQFAPAEAWGAAYLTVAGLLVAWRMIRHQWVGVAAHTLASILTVWWLLAFVVRYSTDNATTIVNVVSWSVFLSLVIRSSGGLDEDENHDGPGA
jgi:hypothetical protein